MLYFCDNFYTMSFSFQTKVPSRGFHIYKNTVTWENVNVGQEISVQLETNEDSKKVDPYCCDINGLWKTGDSRSYTKGGFKAYLLLH